MIFRRKAARAAEETFLDTGTVDSDGSAADSSEAADELSARAHGPWDRSETTADADDATYIDLGGLVVKGASGLELRLQVDEQTSAVSAVMLAGPTSGLELRAFAAPRHDGIWDDVRPDIAAEAVKRGGSTTEVDGEFGTELKVVVPITLPDGRNATQESRIVGVDGPRWLLRGTFLGKSAQEPDPDGDVERAFRSVIVVRGDGPMAPREILPMTMPAQATQAATDASDEQSDEESEEG